MGAASTEQVRNVVLVGHGGAGKTSLAEAALFMAGRTKRLGSVEEGHSTLDSDPEELKRKMTINLALAPLMHKDIKVNLIDTPGYADFVGDAVAGMWAAEVALFVVDAVSGVQVQTERLWDIAGEMGIPRAVFVNRMDKEHADFDSVLKGLRSAFGSRLGALQVPIGKEAEFGGVVDVVRMRALRHGSGGDTASDVPEELASKAEQVREELTELVAEADDALLEKYLEGEGLTQDELESLLGSALAQGLFIPVFAGSALELQGVGAMLDGVASFFPAPSAHAPLKTAADGGLDISPNGDASLFVFKTLSDPYQGRLNFVKVITGTLTPNSELVNSRTSKKERVGHILELVGKEAGDIDGVSAGDIAVLPKLTDTTTNDTLSAKGDVALAPLPLPEPLYSVAIRAKNKADEDKLGGGLNKIVEEEPTLRLRRDAETRQTVLSALGDTQIDVVMSRLEHRFNVETELVELRIPYRETVRKTAQAQGRHKKQTGGHGQFGDCWLRIEPNPGGGYEFLDEIVGGRIPRGFIPAIDKGVQETMERGVLAGYPVVDVKVAVYDGSYHSVDSSEMAFRTAASIGFKAAAEKAQVVLLEPIANLSITVPEQYAGDVMGDLSSRRGRILGMEASGSKQVIRATAPYAEVVTYSLQLRSLTHGAGSYSMEIGEYAEVPSDMARKVVEQTKSKDED